MPLVVLGLNHKTVPVDIREKYNFSLDTIGKYLKKLDTYNHISEMVILSTCNRTEIYSVVNSTTSGKNEILNLLHKMSNFDYRLKDEEIYFYQGKNCIRHLFKVVSSLDSLVIGESQILCQVKESYTKALEMEATSTILNTLFHRAIATGKKVRSKTKISYNAVSVSSAAVEMATKELGSLKGKKVLIYGAGQMAFLTAQHLISKGCGKIFVANHRLERAEELAKKIDGTPLDFTNAIMKMHQADIIITSTGATHYVIKPWEAENVMKKRKDKLVIIDIAVPRDVDPKVAELDNICLYNIDDLQEVVESNIHSRCDEAKKGEIIIEEEVESLLDRFRYLSCQPLMDRITKKADLIRRRMEKRYLSKLNLTEEESKLIDQMTQHIVRKLLRDPMTKLNKVAKTDKEILYKEVLADLFKIEDFIEED